MTLPKVLKMDGIVRAYVELVPQKSTDELIADQGNNSITSANTKELEKRLFMGESRLVLSEGKGRYVSLTRSGDWSMDETFTLSETNSHGLKMLSVPQTVTIGKGQSAATFSVIATDNSEVNSQYRTGVTATATGYTTSKRTITVQDNDWPQLSMSLSRNIISEGDGYGATMATITRTGNLGANLPVYVSSNAGKELYFDSQYNIIPAGQSTITIPVSYTPSPNQELLYTRLTEPLAAGETRNFTFSVEIPTHLTERQYYVVGWLNNMQNYAETNKTNGVSPGTPITIRPSFVLASISTDRDIYTRGNTIRFTGQMTNDASGLPMKDREVDVYLLNDEKRYQVTTTLDRDGNFAAEYVFGEQTGGRYRIGACAHGSGRTDTDGFI